MIFFADAANTLLGLALMLALGYFLGKFIKVNDSQINLLSELVIVVAIPCMLFSLILNELNLELLSSTIKYTFCTIAVFAVCMLLSYLVSKPLKVSSKRRGLFLGLCSLSNSILLGFPICVGLFGSAAVPYIMAFYIANTLYFWIIGYPLIRRDAGHNDKIFSFAMVKKVFLSPPIVTFLLGLIVLFIKLPVPVFIMDTVTQIGKTSTPLAMIYIGMILFRSGLDFKFDKDVITVILFRFIVSPALMLVAVKLLKAPVLAGSVLILQAAMPIMTQASVVAGREGADAAFGAKIMALTTVISLFTSSATAYLVQFLF